MREPREGGAVGLDGVKRGERLGAVALVDERLAASHELQGLKRGNVPAIVVAAGNV
jgi:hypothetical protein